jgi:2',3'-cyclic-nucleotide 2'-phosphodiesterase (5'-nucleotidase family)
LQSLGNHEFDLGVSGLVPFMENVTFPIVCSNLDVSNEPRLQGKFSRSTTITVGGRKIGIVGYLTPETKSISSTGGYAGVMG